MIKIDSDVNAVARAAIAMYRCAGIAYSRGQTAYGSEVAAMADKLIEAIRGIPAAREQELIKARNYYAMCRDSW